MLWPRAGGYLTPQTGTLTSPPSPLRPPPPPVLPFPSSVLYPPCLDQILLPPSHSKMFFSHPPKLSHLFLPASFSRSFPLFFFVYPSLSQSECILLSPAVRSRLRVTGIPHYAAECDKSTKTCTPIRTSRCDLLWLGNVFICGVPYCLP